MIPEPVSGLIIDRNGLHSTWLELRIFYTHKGFKFLHSMDGWMAGWMARLYTMFSSHPCRFKMLQLRVGPWSNVT